MCVIPVEKVFSRPFQRNITSSKIPKVSVGKSRKTNLQLFTDCRAWWSKEPKWENDCGSFSPCFLLVKVTAGGETEGAFIYYTPTTTAAMVELWFGSGPLLLTIAFSNNEAHCCLHTTTVAIV